jgi:hypothetical protein
MNSGANMICGSKLATGHAVAGIGRAQAIGCFQCHTFAVHAVRTLGRAAPAGAEQATSGLLGDANELFAEITDSVRIAFFAG